MSGSAPCSALLALRPLPRLAAPYVEPTLRPALRCTALAQVDDVVLRLALDEQAGTWTLQPLSPAELADRMSCRIKAKLPAAPLLHPPEQQRAQGEFQGGGLHPAAGAAASLHAAVRCPAGLSLCGWGGGAAEQARLANDASQSGVSYATSEPAKQTHPASSASHSGNLLPARRAISAAWGSPVCDVGRGGAEQQQESGAQQQQQQPLKEARIGDFPGDMQALHVLANVDGLGYMPTVVEVLSPAAGDAGAGSNEAHILVSVAGLGRPLGAHTRLEHKSTERTCALCSKMIQ